jgi:signal transduction histidine kinase
VGIRPEDRTKLFRAFEQATDRSTQQQQEGTGLGLYLCQQLVTLLKGQLTVQSQHGEGSRFTLSLLAVAETPMSEAAGAVP